ncbi:MAG: hypothetical protein IJ172_07085, partial [Ruminococcus sp.]|nr:hypothetical protein [Ruminococcus sp.]
LDSSKKDESSKKQTSSSSSSSQADGNYVEWSVEDLSALIESSVRGKPVAQAQQVFNEKLGTDPSKWTVTENGKYTVYEQELETGIKVYETVFTHLNFVEYEHGGVVYPKSNSVGFYRLYKEKGQADTAEARFNNALKADGFKGDMTTFMNRWLTSSGKVSCGAMSYKTYRGKFGMTFWAKDQNAQ